MVDSPSAKAKVAETLKTPEDKLMAALAREATWLKDNLNSNALLIEEAKAFNREYNAGDVGKQRNIDMIVGCNSLLEPKIPLCIATRKLVSQRHNLVR